MGVGCGCDPKIILRDRCSSLAEVLFESRVGFGGFIVWIDDGLLEKLF
jgi:hypothetical protein